MKRIDLALGVAILAALCLMAGAASLTANAAFPLPGRPASPRPGGDPVVRHPDRVSQAVRSNVSRPLREIPARITQSAAESDNENPPLRRPTDRFVTDSVLQKLFGPLAMPTPIQNFDGIYNVFGPIPPDTNGDVGRNHYVQVVNSGFQVFTKTGTSLYGPANNNTLFTGFGGLCETTNSGDPIALYDPMADRWMITQFTGQSNPTHQCIAISASPDPMGNWYRYDFIVSPTASAFEDYPHLGVWPDGYYMTTNEFGGPNSGGNYAFDRAKMLRGDPSATMIFFGSPDGGLLPSDLDGNPPPAGSPNYFFEWYNNSPGELREFKFHADFTNPGMSTFTGPFSIAVPNFAYPVCTATRDQCIDQLGTTARLETIGDRLMFRVAYRNFGSYESLVLNHTVNATGGSPGVAAPRWYELRAPNGAGGATLQQSGTYYPGDGVHRWMGSIAQDSAGDIAMGFSASSSTEFPSIRYAGRIPSDPPGTFGQGEATLFAGTGSEDYPAAPRWGDYSNISVDPFDECTFWYTTEYFSQTALRAWRTRIGSFKFPSCTSSGTPTPVATATGAVPTFTPTRATATPCVGNISYTGSITNTDPIQTNRLGLSDPKSTCAAPRPLPATSDMLTRHYRSYSYTNSSSSPQCVTVSVVQNCGNNALQSVAYLGSFNPNSINTNYLAHGGASGQQFSYSFTLAAGQTAVVVALEVSPNIGCANYNLTINPCGAGGATNTPTPTSPAGSPSPTRTVGSPTVTPTTVCVGTTYKTITSVGLKMIPATNDIGNHCDDCNTTVALPFPVNVYGTVFTSTNIGSNGLINFGSSQQNIYTQNCLPVRSNPPAFSHTLFAYYDDLRTDVMTETHGIYTATVGTAPNRDFLVQWHTTFFFSDTAEANFEVILHENSPHLTVIYGASSPVDPDGANPATGIQLSLGQYTAYSCHTEIPFGTVVNYVPFGCGTTPTATATPTACAINFSDVGQTDYFYPGVRWLYCRGAISGYADGTFRPYNNTTRSQMVKILVLAYGMTIYTPPTPTFRDEPASDTFYQFVETAVRFNIVSGYNCGGPGEPCPGLYFRPYNLITRGQLSKIIVVSAGWALLNPPVATFNDVPPNSTFYEFIETAVCHGVVSGYDCGGPGEPCPGRYFREGNNATRGQIAKMVYNAVSNLPCVPAPTPTAMALPRSDMKNAGDKVK